jgi:hypothetical protein
MRNASDFQGACDYFFPTSPGKMRWPVIRSGSNAPVRTTNGLQLSTARLIHDIQIAPAEKRWKLVDYHR